MDDRSETDRLHPIERIAVIVVLTACICFGALGLVQVFTWRHSVDEGNVAAAKAQVKQFDTALVAYKISFKEFPNSLDGLVNPPSGEPIMNSTSIPLDPWGNAYQYALIGEESYELISLGADGEPGGSDEDADIRSDELAKESTR